ncbi:DUF2059 domain-containing protein [Fertoebacter nigrum]|uniref:DUF2059 domain-containing protein n=1 Tax=Fertoeibacter niger TaxID=2656921 RepID=A0A8X8GYG1_9RHOB|nr:DUF2059 domain-containing protein [Fertoeibacter niger]NUB46584.1 DUF2059 domain-containing protein [Fertoeibacter niger]
MILRPLALALALCLPAFPLAAQTPPNTAAPDTGANVLADPATQILALTEALMIGPVIDVMRAEGLDYGSSLEGELFGGSGGARWQAVVGMIYDTATMRERFDAVFAAELATDPELEAMLSFFGSAQGQRILTLELEARRALMDEAAEEAAKVAVEDMIADADPRMEVLRRFAEANDLIESNVAGALNSNLAFFKGMSEGGAFGDAMTEEQMLADVWGQEPEIRTETTDWLFPYLALAYGPLPDEDMQAYLAFSETPAGQRLNAAVFAAFDKVFTAISYDLGRAAARQMQGEDI